MDLSPVTSNEIWGFIGTMKVGKSFGPYSVPVTILKIIRDYISEHLAFLVNDSFTSDNFSDILKLARIRPLSLRKARDLTKTIIGPFLFFLILVKQLKKPYIIACIEIGRILRYSIHSCFALEKIFNHH